jgi:hypothetical protein
MTEIRVPTLGELVTEATVGKWFKQPGDPVAVDEPLVELETDKVTIEVPAPVAGVLGDIAAKDGEKIAVGALLGQIKDGVLDDVAPLQMKFTAPGAPTKNTKQTKRTTAPGRAAPSDLAKAFPRPGSAEQPTSNSEPGINRAFDASMRAGGVETPPKPGPPAHPTKNKMADARAAIKVSCAGYAIITICHIAWALTSSLSSLLEAVVFATCGYQVLQESRLAGLIGFVLFSADLVFLVGRSQSWIEVLAYFAIGLLIYLGLWGTATVHRLSTQNS